MFDTRNPSDSRPILPDEPEQNEVGDSNDSLPESGIRLCAVRNDPIDDTFPF